MAGSIKAEGLNEISSMLEDMGKEAHNAAAAGLYEGAGYMADALSKAVETIKTEKYRHAENGQMRMPSPEEKRILQNAAKGIAKFKGSGAELDTSVGFSKSGYAMLMGKRKPVAMIASSINSGTSFMKKQPFIRKTVSREGKKAVKVIEKAISDRIMDIWSGGKWSTGK